jgi:hypothetical protein
MSKRTILCGLVLAGFVLAMLPGCGAKVSKSNYDKVKDGMTLAEVEKILGKGEAVASVSGALGDLAGSSKTYKWVNEADGITITITFVNDKMQLKTATGI